MEKIRNKFISIFEVQLKEKIFMRISIYQYFQPSKSFYHLKKTTFVRVDYFDGKLVIDLVI